MSLATACSNPVLVASLGNHATRAKLSKDKMREGEKVAEQRHSAKMLDKTDL